MRKFIHFDTIIAPNVTEKSTSLSEFNKIVFKVHKGASKDAIKRSIEKLFKVKVIKVNTINLKGTTKMVRNKDLLLQLAPVIAFFLNLHICNYLLGMTLK